MKFEKPENENYCANIVKIKNVIPLENCDNIQATVIFGNRIIISKETQVGDIGVYFPAETQLSDEFTATNNLYRHAELNTDKEKTGYIGDNRRIRTMKMRGNQSCGLFMPLTSLESFTDISELKIGDTFDKLHTTKICNKYIVRRRTPGMQNKTKKKVKKISKVIDGQFHFHDSTSHFGKNAHLFKPNDIISITYKLHGTSVVISKVLCKKRLGLFYKLLRWLKLNVVDTTYDNLYSSRKVIKNDDMNKYKGHYYNVDIWGLANEKLKEHLLDGMTLYGEIVGFTPEGNPIQKFKKSYDYGCKQGEWEVYIYRITYTNPSGNVFEFSAKQVQDWCNENGIKAVPELYYGKVESIFEWKDDAYSEYYDEDLPFEDNLINILQEKYLEKNCFMCKNKVPAEGIVIRKETNYFDAFKFKSFAFLKGETEALDRGEVDIEEEN